MKGFKYIFISIKTAYFMIHMRHPTGAGVAALCKRSQMASHDGNSWEKLRNYMQLKRKVRFQDR